jgi:diguanylate cyclase (GGDEF)-like protein
MAATAELAGVITAATSPDVTISRIAGMVGVIPGLGERVQQYARLYYARVNQDWADGDRTLLLLGPRVVAEVASQQSVVTAVQAVGLPSAVEQMLWLDALRLATAARCFAKQFSDDVHEDAAFTVGLCLELGLAQTLYRKKCYASWVRRYRSSQGAERADICRVLMGCSTSDSFALLSSGLTLPPDLLTAVAGHGTNNDSLANVLVWADRLCQCLSSPDAANLLEEFVDDVSLELFCATGEVWDLLDELDLQVDRAAEALGVDVAPRPSMAVLQERQDKEWTVHQLLPSEVMHWTEVLEAQVAALEYSSGSMADRLEQMHGHDPLTGLITHRLFLEVLEREVASARIGGRHAWVLLVDVDRFTELNHRSGFDCGDTVLEQVVVVLRSMLPEARATARVGGDSFAVLLDIDDWRVRVVGERVRAAIEATKIDVGGVRERVTVTIAGMGLSALGEEEGHEVMFAKVHALIRKLRRGGNQTIWPN